MIYSLADINLFEDPQTYQYSPFQGAEFITAWALQRKKKSTIDIESSSWIKGPRPTMFNATESAGEYSPSVITLAGLIQDIDDIQSNEYSNRKNIAPWLKVFEVRKRLHGSYDPQMRPLNGEDFRQPDVYLQFATLMEAAWCRFSSLPYLNALLKVLDTLSSVASDLKDHERILFSWLIRREALHIEMLSANLKVSNDG